MADKIIEARNIVVRFGIRKGLRTYRFNAVDGASIEIGAGEILGLVGESGSGKTTLGKVTLGLIKPFKGEVLFKGKNIYEMSKEEFKQFRINAQYIPQDPYASLHPLKRVGDTLIEILLYHRLVHSRQEALEHVSTILEMVGLSPPEKYLNKYPQQLSGGERQRLSIARALTLRPAYIVADEPVTMLDASLKAGVVKTLRDLVKKFNSSLLFITHEILLLQFFGENTKIAVMYLGEVVERGSVKNVLPNPLHPYTQALLSAIPIPDPKARETRKVVLKGEIPSPLNKPQGCPLHPRCPFAMDICKKEKPPLVEVEKDHHVSCWLYVKS